jgi:hypothetical protein
MILSLLIGILAAVAVFAIGRRLSLKLRLVIAAALVALGALPGILALAVGDKAPPDAIEVHPTKN